MAIKKGYRIIKAESDLKLVKEVNRLMNSNEFNLKLIGGVAVEVNENIDYYYQSVLIS